jgi:hypothetical protein
VIGENVNRLLVVVAVALSSLAQAQPTLTPHPIEVLTRGVSKAQLEVLQNEYRRVLTGQVIMPANRAILSAVADLKRQDCAVSDDCLKKLAVLGGSTYAMHVSGTQDPKGNALMVARVVREDGKLMIGPVTLKEPKKGSEPIEVTMMRGLSALLGGMNFSQLPSSREVTPPSQPPPVAVVDAGVVVTPAEPVDAGVVFTMPPAPPLEASPLKSVGTVTLIAGGSVALIGGVLFGIGKAQASGLSIKDGAVRTDQAPSAVVSNTLQGVGVSALAVGGSAAVAGLVMMLIAPAEPKKVTASVAPVPGGSMVLVGGEW